MAELESKILIVDDDKGITSALSQVLEEYHIEIANDARSALTLLKEHVFRLILVDLKLPDVDGMILIDQIMDINPSSEFIIISGHLTQEVLTYAIGAKHIIGCIQKPLETKYIQGLIFEVIKRQKIEMQAQQAQLELKESQAKYRDLYDNAPDMFVSVDASTAKITECNITLMKATGYTKEELIGMHIFDLYHPDCLEKAKRTFALFKETGEVHNRELQLMRKDGSKIYVILNVSSVRDENGEVMFSRSSWRDITDIKLAEARFKAMFDNMTSGVAVYESYDNGKTFTFIDMNASGEKITQTPKKDLIGKNLLEVFPGCSTDDFDLLGSFQKVWKTGKPVFHPACKYEDSRIESFYPENSIYKLDSGELVAIFTDVSDKQEAEHDLQVSLELKTALLDNMEELVLFFKGPELRIAWANAAAAKHVNMEMKDLKGRLCYELFAHRKTPCKDCPVLWTFKTGQSAELVKENGGTQVLLSKTVKVDANGMSGVMEISTDITTEVQLQQLFKTKMKEWVTVERENNIDLKREKLKLNQSLLKLADLGR